MARTPPPEFPVRTFPVPVIADQVLIESITSENANSSPIEPGTPHPNTRDFSGFKLGAQKVNAQDPYWTIRIWVTDATNEDLYNYAIKFSGDNVSNPIFVHSYRERKDTYARRTNGSALQVVYKLVVNVAGSGYTVGTQPALTFTGGAGTGAAGRGIVKADGTISEFVLTSGGSGYTSAPTFTVAAPDSGVTATGTANIQPTTAILVSEETQQFPQDSEFFAQYFNVLRVYETLPGPYLPFTRYDENLGPIQGRRRAVVNTGQASSQTATVKTNYEARDGSSYVSWEIEETNSNGTGSGSNPVYPTFVIDDYDNERGAFQVTRQLIVKIGNEVGTLTESGGTITKTTYEDFKDNTFLIWKIIETYSNTGPSLPSKRMSDGAQGAITTVTRQQIDIDVADVTPTFKTLEYSDTAINAVSKQRSVELVTDSTFPTLSDYDIDEETGQTILTTYQIVDASTAGTASISSGVVTKYKKIDKWRSMKIISTYSTPSMYEEQRLGAQPFPTLFDASTYSWTSECGAFAGGLRGGFSAMVRLRTEVTFSTSRHADIDGLTLIPKTLLLGKGVLLPDDLIVDAGTFTYSGTCVGSVSFGGSDPDYSTYLASIQNTEQLIAGESVKSGKGGMYRTTLVYCYML